MRWRVFLITVFFLFVIVSSVLPQELDTQSLEQLDGLAFDDFLENSYHILLQRDPEWVVELGIQDSLGSDVPLLTNISDDYARETDTIIRDILNRLQDYDRGTLTAEQQLSYDIYHWFLDDKIRTHEFRLHNFHANFFITGVHNSTQYFFTEIHPLENIDDAEDYIARLWLVDDKFEQLIDNINLSAEAGIIPPSFVIQWTLGGINYLAGGSVQGHVYYQVFAEKLDNLMGLSDSQRDDLLSQAEAAVRESVMPAYAQLASALSALQSQAPDGAGVWQYPLGGAYYDYLLRHYTTTNMSADEIHQLGLQELDRVHAEMRVIFKELGYPEDESVAQLYSRLGRDGLLISGNDVVTTFEQILADAENNISGAFNNIPEADVVVIGGGTGGFYIPGALDGSRPGAFYASVGGRQPYYNMPSLLYHETVPGHHLQIAWSQEMDLPAFRRSSTFTAYVEGWALYAERLAWELGWYDDDPAGNLGRLQYEAFRAARLVVDTGIHSQKWTFNEAVDFFAANTGFNRDMSANQIARYVVYPGQANAYMIGMLKILELRDTVENEQGSDFHLADFHDLVLDNGSMPLELLEKLIQDSIAK